MTKRFMNTASAMLLSATAADTGAVSVALTKTAKASALAAKVDENMTSDMLLAMEAKEKSAMSTLDILSDLMSIYGAELSSFPVPDSVEGKSNNPDKYTVPVKVNGETKHKPGNFYTDFFIATPLGVQIEAQIALIKEANDNGGKCDDARISAMSAMERSAELYMLNGRKATGRGVIKRAMKVYFQWLAVGELKDKVSIRYLKTPDGAIKNTPKPIVISDAMEPTTFELLSVGTFLSLDVAEAAANGGDFAALKATNARGSDDEGQDDADTKNNVNNVKQAQTAVYALSSFLGTDEGMIAFITALNKGKAEDRAEFVEAVGELCGLLNGQVYPKIKDEYTKIITSNKAAA